MSVEGFEKMLEDLSEKYAISTTRAATILMKADIRSTRDASFKDVDVIIQEAVGSKTTTLPARKVYNVGMSREERKQLANSLHNYVEKAYVNDQSRREFYDHLIETYREKGQTAIDDLDWHAFRELLDEAL